MLKVKNVESWTEQTDDLLSNPEVLETINVPLGATLASQSFKDFKNGSLDYLFQING